LVDFFTQTHLVTLPFCNFRDNKAIETVDKLFVVILILDRPRFIPSCPELGANSRSLNDFAQLNQTDQTGLEPGRPDEFVEKSPKV
jgi:hypothetical protein